MQLTRDCHFFNINITSFTSAESIWWETRCSEIYDSLENPPWNMEACVGFPSVSSVIKVEWVNLPFGTLNILQCCTYTDCWCNLLFSTKMCPRKWVWFQFACIWSVWLSIRPQAESFESLSNTTGLSSRRLTIREECWSGTFVEPDVCSGLPAVGAIYESHFWPADQPWSFSNTANI